MATRRHRRGEDLACLALLALAVAAFFWPLFIKGAWIPRGGGDLVSFLWPMYQFAARSLRSGSLPLWNPHLHSGVPFAADNQSGLFYPPNLLTFAFFGPPSYAVMEGLVLFHMWLAAAAMFALLRGLGLGRPAAVLGSLAFGLSDLFVTHVGNLNLNAAAAWLPLLVLLTHRALERRSAAWASGTGAVLAVAALAGHGQILLFLGLAVGLYVFYYLVKHSADPSGAHPLGSGWRRAGKTAGLALIVAAVGFGGAALMLMPAYQMAGHSGRGHLSYQEATRYSLPPRSLIGLLAPGFYGRGPANFWGPWDRVEVGYAGVGTLVLATLSLTASLNRLCRGRTPDTPAQRGDEGHHSRFPLAYFGVLIPVAFVLAMGRYTPAYRLAYRVVPTLDRIRAPARLIVLGDFGLAAVASYGLDRLLRDRRWLRRRAKWVGLASVLAGLILLVGALPAARALPPSDRVPKATRSMTVASGLLALNGVLVTVARVGKGTGWLFPLLLAVDLIGLGSTVEIEPHDPTLGFEHHDVVAFLQQDPSQFRIESTSGVWQPDAALVHGLYDVGGVYNPLGLAPYEAYRWATGERGAPLYDLLGVKYVLADKGMPPGDARLVPVYDASAQIDVYLNTVALPRALYLTCAQVVSGHGAAWAAIHATTFDPARVVVLEREQLEDSTGAEECVEEAGGAQVSFAHYGANRVALNVDSQTTGWLVLTDVYYPGWRASVDGMRTPVLRADYTFRAVRVPAGTHQVEMRFVPWTWYVGLALSLLTWGCLAVGAVAKLRPLRSQVSCLSGNRGQGPRSSPDPKHTQAFLRRRCGGDVVHHRPAPAARMVPRTSPSARQWCARAAMAIMAYRCLPHHES
jgi:hypothetical protein